MRRAIGFSLFLAVLAAQPLFAVEAPLWPSGVHLPRGVAVDEDYRQQFGACDRTETFRGHATHGCGDDPNRVTALRRLPDGSIAYVSKLAVDLDGSAFACGPEHGRMDQCPTSLMLADGLGGEVPVDADAIPYVVIPAAGPPDVAGEFSRRTGVKVGDFGVVLARGRVVPVIVADTGPFAKLGEGSLALHRALGRELCAMRDTGGTCRRVVDDMESIDADVTTILFPGTARHDLTPATIATIVHQQGNALWANRGKQRPGNVAARWPSTDSDIPGDRGLEPGRNPTDFPRRNAQQETTMTPDERTLLSNFMRDVASVGTVAKDADADALIHQTLAAYPDAAYLLVQHAIVADQSLHAAQARIAQLEDQVRAPVAAPSPGFLPQPASPWGAQPAPQYAPQQYAPPPVEQRPGIFSGGGGLGSFLRSAGTTAAGVAGGEMLFGGLSDIFGGHHGGGMFGGGGGQGFMGQPQGETVVNNYYGDDSNGGDDQDSGSDDGSDSSDDAS